MFVAAAGAAAAFAGLLFVAVSINLGQILKYEGLPERALETLTMLLSVLVISLIVLAPGLSNKTLGIVLLIEGVLLNFVLARILNEARVKHVNSSARSAQRVAISAAVGVPLIIGSISLIRDSGGGLYWILGGVIMAFIGSAANAWVLLVEIQR